MKALEMLNDIKESYVLNMILRYCEVNSGNLNYEYAASEASYVK